MVGGEFSFVRCGGCGSAILRPQPPPDVIRQAYPDGYMFRREEGGGLARLIRRWEWALFYRRLIERETRPIQRLPLPRTPSLLDVGCGEGYRLEAFRQAGMVADGLEYSDRAAEHARALGLPVRSGTLEMHAEELAGRYDVVTFFDVLEHLPDMVTTLHAARRVLKTPGWIVARVPLVEALTLRWFGARHVSVREAPRHLLLPTRRGVDAALVKCGFERAAWQPAALSVAAGLIGLSLVSGGVYGNAARGGLARYLVLRGLSTVAAVVVGLPLAWAERTVGPSALALMVARTRPDPAA